MRFTMLGLLMGVVVGVLGSVTGAWAAEPDGGAGGGVVYFSATVIAGGFGMAIASGMAAFAQGRAIVAALDGIARQPNAAGRIQTALIIGLAFIESLAIYVLLIAFILLFADPFSALLTGGA